MNIETPRHSVLAAEQREAVRLRILTATKRIIADQGFEVTVDQIAGAAEVGRRTVFRYFASREALLTAALEDWLRDYVTRLPASPEPGQDPHAWLAALALQVQGLNVELVFWDIQGRRSRLADNNEEIFKALATARGERRSKYAVDAWLAFGGTDKPPGWVVDAFAIALSGYATNSLLELGRTPEQIAEVVCATLEAVLKQALSEPNR